LHRRAQPKSAVEGIEMLKGFRDFILRGNVVDLAVAVILGAAFNAIVTSLVKDVLTQLIAAVAGKPDFSAIVMKVNGTPILIGNFLNATFSFLIVTSVIYFGVVLPLNKLVAKLKKPAPEAAPMTKPCPECLSEIPLAARRCRHCAQPVA
jgi:large conductance mechanosensitive channel